MGGAPNKDAEWFNRPRGYVQRPLRQWLKPSWWWLAWAAGFVLSALITLEYAPRAMGCAIKGNINSVTRERIYHVPGQQFYPHTRINYFRGERWFCSEAEAVAAGWRKAKI